MIGMVFMWWCGDGVDCRVLCMVSSVDNQHCLCFLQLCVVLLLQKKRHGDKSFGIFWKESSSSHNVAGISNPKYFFSIVNFITSSTLLMGAIVNVFSISCCFCCSCIDDNFVLFVRVDHVL